MKNKWKTLFQVLCLLCLLLLSGCSQDKIAIEQLPLEEEILFGMSLDEVGLEVKLNPMEETDISQEVIIEHAQSFDIGSKKFFTEPATVCLMFSEFDKGDFNGYLIGYSATFPSDCKVDKIIEKMNAIYGESNGTHQEESTIYNWRYGSVDKIDEPILNKMKTLLFSAYDSSPELDDYIETYYHSLIRTSYPLLEIKLVVPKVPNSEKPIYMVADGLQLAAWLKSK